MTIRFPGPVPKDAMDFMKNKGLRVGFSYQDVFREEHGYAFTVAKAMQVDILTALLEALETALAEGRTLAQFKKELTPTLQRLGWWGVKEMEDPVTGEVEAVQLGSPRRLKTIFRANMRQARGAGQWARVQRSKAAMPYLRYSLGPSRVHRKEHERWAETLLPVDHPWWNTHFPPNGYNCKCRARQVGKSEMRRRGWQITEAPAVKRVAWENKRTGETMMVPEGIDPGWDHNPGKDRQKHMDEFLAGKLDGADPVMAETARKDLAAYREGASV